MTARGAVGRGRRAAEAQMTDACVIRPVAGDTTDPVTGVVSTSYGDPVYTGRCKLQRIKDAYPSTPEGGDRRWTTSPATLHLPVAGSGNVGVGHVVTMTASTDVENVGREFRVRSDDRKSLQTAIRFVIQEVID